MATILSQGDFKGFVRVVLSPSQVTRFEQIIEQTEFNYLSRILGVELAELFKTDYLDNVGNTGAMEPRFGNLLKEMNTQWGNQPYDTISIKESLTMFIFADYYEDLHTIITSVGVKQTQSENSKTPTISRFKHYNLAVKKGKAVQAYILENIGDYPEFRGQRLYNNNPIW